MATTHWMTNRGKFLALNGTLTGATTIYLGLLSGASVPAAIDTEVEGQDLNDVAAFLALTAVDEPAGGWYSRKTLGTTANTEDDTNNWTEIDCADPSAWTAATAGDNICGFFTALEGGTDAQDQLISWGTISPVIPTNGSNIAATIAGLYRGV